MDVLTLAALAALAMKIVDVVKFATNKNVNAVVTQVAVWAAGVIVIFLASAANISKSIAVSGMALQDLNAASKVLVGLGLLSAGSIVYDFKKATDTTDSAVTPSLIPPTATTGE